VGVDLWPVDGHDELVVVLLQESEQHEGRGHVMRVHAGGRADGLDRDLKPMLRPINFFF
jgi:hypothetical protein